MMDYRFEPHVVVIGGGTGLSVLLSGLKRFTSKITAVVTVADDGGGSGALREDIGMLPPGDIRSCILALSNTEPSMSRLLNHRFSQGLLKGQNFGNLFIAAMNEIYGSFDKAIEETSNVLAVTGRVYPVTLDNVTLTAVLENNIEVSGESTIPKAAEKYNSRISQMSMEPNEIYTSSKVLEAIDQADLIVLGPGSLYTSVIPNLLVNGIVESLMNTKAPKVYICNVMTQKGETPGYSVKDHVKAIIKHSHKNLLSSVLINDAPIPEEQLIRYSENDSEPVSYSLEDEKYLRENKIVPITGTFYEIKSNYVRHNNIFVSQKLYSLADGYCKHKLSNQKTVE